ncbi:MAG: hypothetical protein ACI9NT_001508 [Bacteroidia bacterium]|jgi:uncharacterized protein (DUF1499 family)
MNQTNSTPGLIRWAGYIALTLLIIIPLAVLTVRSGAWTQGLGLYAIATMGSVLMAIVFVILLLLPRFASARGDTAKRLLLAIPGTALTMSLTLGGGNAPRIHDITTDTENPPVFVTALQQRGTESNPLDIKPDFIEQQLAAYPDLQTISSPASIDEAFSQAVKVATDLGWEIYFQDRDKGIIEAVESTAIMAFKDDVVIRVTSNAQGTKIDLRSVSRVGLGDLGANAKRILAFRDAFASAGS